MSEKPILFSGEMVRAILDGRKTMTRRALKVQPLDLLPMNMQDRWVTLRTREPEPHGDVIGSRFGGVGQRLWVRETWAALPHFDKLPPRDIPKFAEINYAADGPCHIVTKWRPSIFLPRWASRITLEITDIRAERLQDITEQDAIAEGMDYISVFPDGDYHVSAFRELWNKINGKKKGFTWANNPFVWCITFKRILP